MMRSAHFHACNKRRNHNGRCGCGCGLRWWRVKWPMNGLSCGTAKGTHRG